MQPQHTQNPYQPPTTNEPGVVIRFPKRPWISFIFAMLSTLAYVGFTLLLIRSSPVDRQVGYFFCFNLPLLIVLLVLLALGRELARYVGLVIMLIQITILVGMLGLRVGEFWAVVVINGIIIAIMVLLNVLIWFETRPKLSPS